MPNVHLLSQNENGGGIGKIAGIGLGILTGNPMQIAGATLGNSSPLGKALNLYNTASSTLTPKTPDLNPSGDPLELESNSDFQAIGQMGNQAGSIARRLGGYSY